MPRPLHAGASGGDSRSAIVKCPSVCLSSGHCPSGSHPCTQLCYHCNRSCMCKVRLIIRDGGGCLYTVIQWITATSVLQSEPSANGTGEEKVWTVHKRMITILSSEKAPAHRKCPWHFSDFVFFFFFFQFCFFFSMCCNQTLRGMVLVSPHYYTTFDPLYSFVHWRVP